MKEPDDDILRMNAQVCRDKARWFAEIGFHEEAKTFVQLADSIDDRIEIRRIERDAEGD